MYRTDIASDRNVQDGHYKWQECTSLSWFQQTGDDSSVIQTNYACVQRMFHLKVCCVPVCLVNSYRTALRILWIGFVILTFFVSCDGFLKSMCHLYNLQLVIFMYNFIWFTIIMIWTCDKKTTVISWISFSVI